MPPRRRTRRRDARAAAARRAAATVLAALATAALPADPAPAEDPLRLDDPRPRWVGVRFEVSSVESPGALDRAWSAPLAAWLEPAAPPGRVRVVVPGPLVERHVLARHGARPGSVGDFRWTFEAATGHVISAVLQGQLERRLGVGFLRWTSRVDIRTRLSTDAPAGFLPAGRVLGELVFAPCDAEERDCTVVAPAPLDPESGYVNAVGVLEGTTGPVASRTFSPLGEARFLELGPEHAATLAEAAALVVEPLAAALPSVAAPPPRAGASGDP